MKMHFLRNLLLIALISLSSGLAAAPAILVLGDSLSAAYGIDKTQGWVSLLEQRLATEKYPYRVINTSISGETTSGGRYRLDSLLARHQPHVVILELGANDGLRGLSLKDTHANLEAMIRSAKQNGAQVLLVGMRLPPNYGPAYTEKFHQLFVNLARQHKTGLVPFLLAPIAGKREYFQADGLHPTSDAQPLLLETVWVALRPLLNAKQVQKRSPHFQQTSKLPGFSSPHSGQKRLASAACSASYS